MSKSTQEHRRRAGASKARCAVLTVSDSRTLADDPGGDSIVERLEAHGHSVVYRDLVPDDPERITDALATCLGEPDLDLVITTGGTGIARRDTTVEIVERHLDKRLEGFGELFRMLSWEQIGPAAMLSRATAGLAGDALLFALPGSLDAVELALDRLILPELPHLIWERRR